MKTNKKSHFEDIPKQETCLDREHEPPKHLHIPAGKDMFMFVLHVDKKVFFTLRK